MPLIIIYGGLKRESFFLIKEIQFKQYKVGKGATIYVCTLIMFLCIWPYIYNEQHGTKYMKDHETFALITRKNFFSYEKEKDLKNIYHFLQQNILPRTWNIFLHLMNVCRIC
jgi:hypothetical protein